MSSNLDHLPTANRILSFLFILIISSTLALSPIISSQIGSSAAFLEINKQEDSLSEIDIRGDSFSAFLPLFRNVAYGQTDTSGDQPSASFPLTVQVIYCPGEDPVPAGTNGDDTIYGTDDAETINGGGGDDQLFGCGGGDTINGGNEKDTIDGGDGNDDLNGGNQDDTINGGDGDDTVDGGNGKDTLNGGAGDDTIIGGNGGETLTGGGGADTFDCGHARDIVTDYNEAEGDILIDCENAIVNTPQRSSSNNPTCNHN